MSFVRVFLFSRIFVLIKKNNSAVFHSWFLHSLQIVKSANVCYFNAFCDWFLSHDAMHKCGLCRHAMFVRASVRLSGCLSRLCILSKQINISSKLFHRRVSHTILLFTYQTLWQYSDRDPLSGTLNPGGVGKNRDSPPIPGSIACCERFDRQVHYTSCSGPWQVGDTHCW